MSLRLENTLTGKIEEFKPTSDPVTLYYCGLTVSDSPHLGHARGWIHVDVLRRWLEHEGYNVRHVENITDVNEKIFKRLSEEDIEAETEQEVADKFTEELFDSMNALNLKRANVYPRVSNHIDEIIDTVESLIEKGYAYESNDSVYFNVEKFGDYGGLSNQNVDDIETQGNPEEVSEKKNPVDFAVWKAVNPDKTRGQTWESPWGHGRPGWHIECSAMSSEHLGTPLDIHIGGQDLVFPHHENEVAQSEAETGERFANHWLHIRLLNSEEDGEKMSSSRHNFETVLDAVDEYGSNAVRWFLLSSNYRNEQMYSRQAIEESQQKWMSVRSTYKRLQESYKDSSSNATITHSSIRNSIAEFEKSVQKHLNNDLNTREALSRLDELMGEVESYLNNNSQYDQEAIGMVLSTFEEYAVDVLGFTISEDSVQDEDLEKLVEFRENLREEEEYEAADLIREAIESAGYELQDTDEGPVLVSSN